jgi:hypothetical protein
MGPLAVLAWIRSAIVGEIPLSGSKHRTGTARREPVSLLGKTELENGLAGIIASWVG